MGLTSIAKGMVRNDALRHNQAQHQSTGFALKVNGIVVKEYVEKIR